MSEQWTLISKSFCLFFYSILSLQFKSFSVIFMLLSLNGPIIFYTPYDKRSTISARLLPLRFHKATGKHKYS